MNRLFKERQPRSRDRIRTTTTSSPAGKLAGASGDTASELEAAPVDGDSSVNDSVRSPPPTGRPRAVSSADAHMDASLLTPGGPRARKRSLHLPADDARFEIVDRHELMRRTREASAAYTDDDDGDDDLLTPIADAADAGPRDVSDWRQRTVPGPPPKADDVAANGAGTNGPNSVGSTSRRTSLGVASDGGGPVPHLTLGRRNSLMKPDENGQMVKLVTEQGTLLGAPAVDSPDHMAVPSDSIVASDRSADRGQGHLARSASAMASLETAPLTRSMTASSSHSPQPKPGGASLLAPPATASLPLGPSSGNANGRRLHSQRSLSRLSDANASSDPRTRRKSSSGKGGSGGIASALAVSGMTLATPHPAFDVATLSSAASMSGGRASTDGHGHLGNRGRRPSDASDMSYGTLASAGSDLLDPNSLLGDGGQITGFAVASSKRNAEFHQMFPRVPEDDYLIEDYGCAWQREILIQGRIYISENHMCFNANLFGWVNTAVIPFSEIASIEKKTTAMIIPNAIRIQTRSEEYIFTSFLSRDSTYDLIVNIWRLSHPGVPVSSGDVLSDEDFDSGDESQRPSVAGSEAGVPPSSALPDTSKPSKRSLLRRKLRGEKGQPEWEGVADARSVDANGKVARNPTLRGSSGASTKQAPHRPTKCACQKHYAAEIMTATFPSTPEKIYNLMFTSGFIKDFMTVSQKLLDLQISEWSPDPKNNNMLTRTMSYIKPLTGSFGPKQTKCLISDENSHVDFDNYISNITTTRTPDVPSGSSFSVKTQTCIMWAGGNSTKVLVTAEVAWTGRSMIKGIIEKASIDGQKQYHGDLEREMRTYIKAHPSEFKQEGEDEVALLEEVTRDEEAKEEEEKATDAAKEKEREKERKAGLLGLPFHLDSVIDFGSSALETIGDLLGGVSPGSVALGLLVLVLLLSNLWTFTSLRDARDGPDPRSASAVAQRHLSRTTSGRTASYPASSRGAGDRHSAPDDSTPEAVAAAVREVLRDYLAPAAWKPGAAVGSPSAEADSRHETKTKTGTEAVEQLPLGDLGAERRAIEDMLRVIEARLDKIRRRLDELPPAADGKAATSEKQRGGG